MSSFDSRLFSVDDYMPMKKDKNGKKKLEMIDKRCFGDECFKTEDFFGGFQAKGSEGIRSEYKADPLEVSLGGGLPIPELGAEYNTRFGRIGTGFTEATDPYSIGFRDILTGNGRTGEIITGGTQAKRGRGRPRKEKTIEEYVGGYKVGKLKGKRGKYPELKSKEVKEREAKGEKVETESKTVGQLLKGAVKSKSQSKYSKADIASERDIDRIQRQRFEEAIEAEKNKSKVKVYQ